MARQAQRTAHQLLALLVLAACAVIGCGEERTGGNNAGGRSTSQSPAAGTNRSQPNVLLLTLDTTRADHLGCYGYAHDTSPHLDSLAAEAVVFEACQASAPVTLPSHCTILTGLDPQQHGVRNNGIHRLDESVTTVAELLHDGGWTTGAVMASVVLAARYGVAQGFDHFDDDFRGTGGSRPLPERTADDVTDRGLTWIRAQGDRPWFAWLHYFDPHDAYHPPAPYDGRFEHPYDGEIAFMDAHLGRLFRELKRLAQWDNTLIVVVADHGEGLGEHGEPTHSLFLYNTTVHVPLIVKPAAAGAAARARRTPGRVDEIVATADIAVTIATAAGLSPALLAPDASPHDLLAAAGSASPRAALYCESLVPELDYGWAPYHGLRTERWKLIFGPEPELYDLRRDPRELTNLHAREAETAAALTATLLDLVGDDQVAAATALDPRTVEQLRSLGYVSGGGGRASGDLADTKSMRWALDAFDRARGHMVRREVEQTIAILRDVLVRDPHNRYAQRVLAGHLLLAGEAREAVTLCDRILAEQPGASDRSTVELWRAEGLLREGKPRDCLTACDALLGADSLLLGGQLLRARALGALDDLDGARAAARAEGRHHPETTEWVVALAMMLMDRERLPEAEAFLNEALTLYPGHADVYAMIGRLRYEQNRLAEAGSILQQVLAVDATHPRARYRLGLVLLAMSNPQGALEQFLRATIARPGNPRYQARLGEVLALGRNYAKAIQHLERAIRLGNRAQTTHFALGSAYAASGRRAEARKELRQALELDPHSPTAREIRARLEELDS